MSYTYTEDELRHLLTEKYNYLVLHVLPREIMPHLISQFVFAQHDREDVMSYRTGIDRAGRMLDLIMMRGLKGMTTFLQILEYDHPRDYFNITKKEAGTPPKDWLEIRRKTSVFRRTRSVSQKSIGEVNDLLTKLVTSHNCHNQAIDHLAAKVKQLESTTTKDEENYHTHMLELEDKNALLSQELMESEQKLAELRAGTDTLVQDKEKYFKLYTDTRARLTECQERYDALHKDFEHVKGRRSLVNSRNSCDLKALQEEVNRLTILVETTPQKEAQDKLSRLERLVNDLSQRNAEFNADMKIAQEERDKTVEKLRMTETDLRSLQEEVKRLREENATHAQRNSHLTQQIVVLQDEIADRTSSST